jgi:replicative DNA helicase
LIKDVEQAVIQKAIEEEEVFKLLNIDIGKCFYLNTDIWDYVIGYHSRYRQAPTLEVLKQKFVEFEPQEVEGVSLEYLIDEVQTVYLRQKAGEILTETVNLLDGGGDPRVALLHTAQEFNSVLHVTQTVKDVDLANDYQMRLNSLQQRVNTSKERGEILGIPSSIPALDYIYGGFQKGDFAIIMGWTGSAKTWLATYLAIQAWSQGFTPLYFSLEMDANQFGYRFDTLVGGGKWSNISLMNARGVDVEEYGTWAEQRFKDKNPFHLVTNESVEEVTQQTVAAKIEQYRPDIVFLDYHGLMEDARRGRNETEKHKNMSRDLKKIAGRYAVPIVDIAGVTMEDGHGERIPKLNEIAWAKALGYDADLVLSMFKEGQLVHVASQKTRRCMEFAFKLTWDFDAGVVSLHDWDG